MTEGTALESSKAVLRLFELIVEQGEAGVSELARMTGEPKTTVQRGLTTLYEAGWLRVVPVGARRRWSPSARIMTLAGKLDLLRPLREAAIPVMGRLRDLSGETVHLTVHEGGEVSLIERVDSLHTLRTVRPLGSRAPLHVTANGKAILAAMPEREVDRYSAGELVGWTERSIVDPARLRRELDAVRARGFAVSDGELDVHIRAVGAAVLDGGDPVAALSISAPASRMTDALLKTNGKLVADAARDLSTLSFRSDR